MITGSNNMEDRKTGKEIRKSLAVDPATYDLLQSICEMEHRSKIDQLKVLIQKEHKRLTSLTENELI
jgi:ferritin-like protein|tara:strand:+ start:211 stop:411 length:201 start_codon:yes stop_codon:yes gene_type:complete